MNAPRHILTSSLFLAMAAVVPAPGWAVDVPTNPCQVIEQADLFGGEYTIQNNTGAESFDIVMLVVTNPAPNPSTPNANWIAQALTETVWKQPMGMEAGHFTWQEYTGLTYQQAFPTPSPANGYFLNYTVSAGSQISIPTNPCRQGETLGNFFFGGVMDSEFLVAGPEDASSPITLADMQTFAGQPVPEPRPRQYYCSPALPD